ncbi:hypothetical protein KCX83_05295 [Brucella oryzae]|uniref:sacsin N-terminal ATP-binding-like domain-containing protein n=1 Tax=Brucella oryzae TaxID=335286 RepID=UPI001B810D05|nr:hypothetical protein [Brucella oryzae]MBR7651737.1 hypothetical protein [Brucella oryzae]
MSNLTTPPRAIFRQIQANLKDRYSSGFPVLKELIQNAEDAKAGMIRFVAHEGWPAADNPLLRVPGLLVSNDGAFAERDGRGILSFADSAKGDDSGTIGRFGFGQKAVFHLCDAFIVHAFGHSTKFSEVVNPCLGVIENTKATTWETIGPKDLAKLHAACLGIERGLLLWLPLRHDDILPAPKLTFIDNRPQLEDLISGFIENRAELHLTLAGLRHLNRIELWQDATQIVGLCRDPDAPRMRGFDPAGELLSLSFKATITEQGAEASTYVGREVSGAQDKLDALRSSEHWPQSPVFTEIGEEMLPEKAEVHAAVVLTDQASGAETLVDWAVFLPVANAARLPSDRARVRLMLHGYFFVDSGRRFIEGFDASSDAPGSVQSEWNTLLRDEVLLPLVPAAIFDAFQAGMLSDDDLAGLLRAVQRSEFGRTHRRAITAQHALARVLEEAGGKVTATWHLLHAGAALRWMPAANARGKFAFTDILPGITDWAYGRGLSLAVRPAALSGGDLGWLPDEIEDLLGQLSPQVFLQGGNAAALAELLEVAIGQDDRLRQAAAPRLQDLLRKALLENTSLANEEHLRAILGVLPPDQVIGLPKSAGRSRRVLRCLAEVREGPLCLSEELLPEGARRQSVGPAEAMALLHGVAPLLERGSDHEAAGAAALCIVRLLGRQLAAFLDDPSCRRLNILRATDGSGMAALVSLSDLVAASRDRRLFRDSPQAQQLVKALYEAAPDRGALIVRKAEADLLDDIGHPFSFTHTTPENFARLIVEAGGFGPIQARARYLQSHFTEAREARQAMRSMAAGQICDDRIRLCALAEGMGPLADLAAELVAGESGSVLVDPEILSGLNRQQSRHIEIAEIRGAELGELLHRNIDKLRSPALHDETALALLQSDVPDENLRNLPIFPSRDGYKLTAAEIWRVERDFPVPPALAKHAPTLRRLNHAASDARMEWLVSPWTPSSLVEVALRQPQPQSFAKEILSALARNGIISLPPAIQSKKWLTDQRGTTWAPDDILDLDPDILNTARQTLAKDGNLAFLPIDELAPEFSSPDAIERLRKHKIIPDGKGSLERLMLLIEEVRPIVVMGEITRIAPDLKALANHRVDIDLPGWPLLAALLRRSDSPAEELLRPFGVVRHGDIDEAKSLLSSLEKPIDAANTRDVAWRVYTTAFEELGRWSETERHALFNQICVRTEAERWALGNSVTLSGNGVPPGHLLHQGLAKLLPADDLFSPTPNSRSDDMAADQALVGMNALKSLKNILEFARAHVPPDLLVLCMGLIERSPAARKLAKESLSVADSDIERIWTRLDTEVLRRFVPQKLLATAADRRSSLRLNFNTITNPPEWIDVATLAGTIANVPTGDAAPLTVLGGIANSVRSVWIGDRNIRSYTLKIAAYSGTQPTSTDVKVLCTALAEVVIGFRKEQSACLDALDRLADECDRLDQTTVDAARAELEDRLPQVLDELKPLHGSGLWEARKAYRDRIDALPVGARQEKDRPAAKHELWEKIASPKNAGELLAAIRQRIEDYGYDPSRVLFELFQNADDAARQHPGSTKGRFRLEYGDGHLTINHWGRLINHPGPDVDPGISKGWRNDLFNMLLMNLSEKREDVTGRFGLGFKSVHLLSKRVSIASHFVSCRIKGGMLPEAWAEGRELSVQRGADGRPATVIEVEIDPERREDAERAFAAFCQAVAWLPVMSRSVRHIEIDGYGEWSAEFCDLDACGIRLVSFGGRGSGHALALDLGEETTLILPLDMQGPATAPEDLPRLWLLAPLAESVATGWLMNGRRFRVDPGRGRLAGSETEHEEMFAEFGRALGLRLVELYDLVTGHWSVLAERAGLLDRSEDRGPQGFLRSLDAIFTKDQDDSLASHLHGRDRGFGRLIAERTALATGLPAPFSPFLRADQARFVMTGAIADTRLLASLHDWQAIREIGRSAIADKVADRIEGLGFNRPRAFRLVDLLRHEIGAEKRATPDLSRRLGKLVDDDFVKSLDKQEEVEILDYLSSLLFQMSDGSWRTAALPPHNAKDGDEEERRILDFAPQKHLAERDYTGTALEFYRLAMRQSGFQRGAAALAQWAGLASGDAQQRAVLSYVLEGRQGSELGRLLAERRPGWLPQASEDLRSSPLRKSVAAEDLPQLLGILYPIEQRLLWSGEGQAGTYEEPDYQSNPQEFLRRLHEWWQESHKKERKSYETKTYPHDFHPRQLAGLDVEMQREGWFTFFALAILRTLGRTQDGAHRNFITKARQAGWWQEMATVKLPADPGPWLRNLEDFARADAWRIDYPQWRRALADLYVLARWLPDYVDAYLNLPKVLRAEEPISLKDVWRLSASPVWQRRGLEGAPLTQSLGLGANWLIREGLRAGLWRDDDRRRIAPYGWAASRRVRKLCRAEIDLDLGESGNMDQSREIYDIVKVHLGPDADFLGDLDLPMQIISDATHEGQLLIISARNGFVESDYGDMDDDLMEMDYDEA